jgi:hypothetical protein
MEVAIKERSVGLDDRRKQDRETPHGEEVRQPGHRPLQNLPLTGHFGNFGLTDPSKALPATRGLLTTAYEPRKPIKATTGHRKTDHRYHETDNDAS